MKYRLEVMSVLVEKKDHVVKGEPMGLQGAVQMPPATFTTTTFKQADKVKPKHKETQQGLFGGQ